MTECKLDEKSQIYRVLERFTLLFITDTDLLSKKTELNVQIRGNGKIYIL